MGDDEKGRRWRDIEAKHFGQCFWQQRSPSGRAMLEGVLHKATGRILVIERTFVERLPKENSYKPWPALIGVQVYAPLDVENQTFEGLDQALANYK